MKNREVIAPLLLAVVAIVSWELLCRELDVPSYMLPPPSSVAGEIFRDVPGLLQNTAVTMTEALAGFLIANVLAIALSVSMVYVRSLEKAVMPFAIGLKTTPIVAMAPLLLLWLGTGMAPKIASAALICFFPALVNSLRGFNALSEGEEDLFRVYAASKTQVLLKLRFWRASPYIMSALKVSSSLAIVGAIVGEFVGANEGIGYLILVSSYHLETARMFAAISAAAIAGILFYAALTYVDKRSVYWLVEPLEEVRLDSPPRKPRTPC